MYIFEKNYIAARGKEDRLYSNEEVRQLPSISPGHPHHKEWLIRERSSRQLITYIKNRKAASSILEVGCGNGWLSHRLSLIPKSNVLGIDINRQELKQATRVFNDRPNLQFIYGSIDNQTLKDRQFDFIVFAASIQYFSSVSSIVKSSFQHLKSHGEIHIIDTHWYKTGEIAAAKERSDSYYKTLGFPEMADLYFHHSLSNLQGFRYKVLYNPSSIFNKFSKHGHPFHWICLIKE